MLGRRPDCHIPRLIIYFRLERCLGTRTSTQSSAEVHVSPITRMRTLSTPFINPSRTAMITTYLQRIETSCLLVAYSKPRAYDREKCSSCDQERSQTEHKRKLQEFPTAEPLKLVALDTLGTLQKRPSGTQHMVITTDHYSELTRTIPNGKTSMRHLASIPLNNQILP